MADNFSITRLQLALNSEDSDLIIAELRKFKSAILVQHNAEETFGYHGRTVNDALVITYPSNICGVLAEYISKSSALEELFILWNLTGRDENLPLAAIQCQVFAAILFCAHTNESLCASIANRLLRDHIRTIHTQLASGNTTLIHSTLGLLISIARISLQSSRDLFQKLLFHTPSFVNLMQKGKLVAQSVGEDKIETDSRCLLFVLLMTILTRATEQIASELLQRNSLIRRMLRTVDVQSLANIKLILDCVLTFIEAAPLSTSTRLSVVDDDFLEHSVCLYEAADEAAQDLAHKFLLTFATDLARALPSQRKELLPLAGAVVRRVSPHTEARHKEIVEVLLASAPSLLQRCVANINPPTWDPQPNYAYLSVLSYLIYLQSHAELDHAAKATAHRLKAMTPAEKHAALETFVSGSLPPLFGRKELSKILQSSYSLVQHTGLLLLQAVLRRVKRFLHIDGKKADDNSAQVAVLKFLPELQLLLALRSRCAKSMSTVPGAEVAVEAPSELQIVSSRLLYLEVMRAAELYLDVFGGALERFDAGRLLDDVVNVTDVNAVISDDDAEILLSTLTLYRHACSDGDILTFGSREDFVKLFTNVVVSKDWHNTLKRSPLTKLLLLAATIRNDVSMVARGTLRLILKRAGLFEGHGDLDHELSSELSSWLDSCDTMASILTLELLLRLAFNWNAQICVATASMIASEYKIEDMLPVSPLLGAALMIVHNDFSVFAGALPSQVKRNIGINGVVDSSAFFDKFSESFQPQLCALLFRIVLRTACSVSRTEGYLKAVSALNGALSHKTGIEGNFGIDLENTMSALNHSLDSSKAASMSHVIGVQLTVDSLVACLQRPALLLEAADVTSDWTSVWKRCVAVSLNMHWSVPDATILASIRHRLVTENQDIQWRTIDFHSACVLQGLDLFLTLVQLGTVAAEVITELGISLKGNTRLSRGSRVVLTAFSDASVVQLLLSDSEPARSQLISIFRVLLESCSTGAVSKVSTSQSVWVSVSDAYLAKYHTASADDADELFRLIWDMQRFIKNSKVRSLLFDKSLRDGGGFGLFALTKKSAYSELDSAASNALVGCPSEHLAERLLEQLDSSTGASALTSVLVSKGETHKIESLLDMRLLTVSSSFARRITSSRLFLQHWSTIRKIGALQQQAGLVSTTVKEICEISSQFYTHSDISAVDLDKNAYESTLDRSDVVDCFELVCDGVFDNWQDLESLKALVYNEALCDTPTLARVVAFLLSFPASERDSVFLHIAVVHLLKHAVGLVDDALTAETWSQALCCALRLIFTVVADAIEEKGDKSVSLRAAAAVTTMSSLLSVPVPDLCRRSLEALQTSIKKQFVKTLKSALKLSPVDALTSQLISLCWHHLDEDQSESVWGILLKSADGDLHSPQLLLQLILGHSKYSVYIVEGPDTLLGLILSTIERVYEIGAHLTSEDVSFLLRSVTTLYKSTLSSTDRLIFRIVYLLNSHGICDPLYLLLQSCGAERSITVDWLLGLLSTPLVYLTISSFPTVRRAIPPPFQSESQMAKESYSSILREHYLELGDQAEDLLDLPDYQGMPRVDEEYRLPSKDVYDPAFWIPAMFFVLSTSEVLVRTLCNTGALALIIVGLSSECSTLRHYSSAALHLVLKAAHSQTSDKDAYFRERHQVLLMLEFLRNGTENPSARIPSLVAQFLSRSAMHLLQPHHELYGKTNKYLLSRPQCDLKDVPLYELVMSDSAGEDSHASERMSILRFIRDGLMSKEDHLNLCRKHIYTRLMMLFPIFSRDARAGNAIFDIFEKGLCLPFSARYLLERCSFLDWISAQAMPVGDEVVSEGGQSTFSAPSRLLARAVILLRRCIHAVFLLSAELSSSVWTTAWFAILGLCDSICDAQDRSSGAVVLPREYCRQILLLLWDFATLHAACTPGKSTLQIGGSRFVRLASTLSRHASDHDKAQVSICALLVAAVEGTTLPLDAFDALLSAASKSLVPSDACPVETLFVLPVLGDALTSRNPKADLFNVYHTVSDILAIAAEGIGARDVWGSMLATDLEQTKLPTSLGSRFTATLMARCLASGLEQLTDPHVACEALRWALATKETVATLQSSACLAPMPTRDRVAGNLLAPGLNCWAAHSEHGIVDVELLVLLGRIVGESVRIAQNTFSIGEGAPLMSTIVQSSFFLREKFVTMGGTVSTDAVLRRVSSVVIEAASVLMFLRDRQVVSIPEELSAYMPAMHMYDKMLSNDILDFACPNTKPSFEVTMPSLESELVQSGVSKRPHGFFPDSDTLILPKLQGHIFDANDDQGEAAEAIVRKRRRERSRWAPVHKKLAYGF